MKEHLLSVNEYNNPKILEGKDSIHLLLRRLLLLTPGSIQSRPNMGVGLISLWRYSDISVLEDLKIEIESQIQTYLPNIVVTDILVEQGTTNKNEIVIQITVDNTVYTYETNNGDLNLYELKGGN